MIRIAGDGAGSQNQNQWRMSRERKYQQGRFENYDPERYELRGFSPQRVRGEDFEVGRGNTADAGGAPDPDKPRGLHRGKGPRNYQRSDERILEDINDRLCDNPYLDASAIEVSVSGGNLVLSGTVEDKESKRMAEDIGESIPGVKNVENRLRVRLRGI